jgi:membrane-bound lytic murein transglycosylase A
MRPAALGRLAWIACGLALASCTPRPGLTPVSFADVPGWNQDRLSEALPAMRRGCDRILGMPAGQALGGTGEAARLAGTAGAWTDPCRRLRAVPDGDEAAARAFLQAEFRPYAVGGDALFTGYYEPEMEARLTRGGAFQTPLLARPADLVQVDLGAFAPDLKGRSVTGRVAAGRLVPYDDRARIESVAAEGEAPALAWVADPADAFFLQIQGSGRLRLPGGEVMRLGFAAQNGRSYVAIGRLLADRGEIPRAKVSMQSIRAWLAAHPGRARALMDENPSYVFFRALPQAAADTGPPGALGASLTPGRSAAVDRAFLPLGVSVWIDTEDPVDGAPLRRLLLAQDTGGAIRGAARADIFFGWGAEAERRAGLMNRHGREFVLLPRAAS